MPGKPITPEDWVCPGCGEKKKYWAPTKLEGRTQKEYVCKQCYDEHHHKIIARGGIVPPDEDAKHCPHCGRELAPGEDKCSVCFSPVHRPLKYCKDCGTILNNDEATCQICHPKETTIIEESTETEDDDYIEAQEIQEEAEAEKILDDMYQEGLAESTGEEVKAELHPKTIMVTQKFLEGLEKLVFQGYYTNISEAIRVAIRDLLYKELWVVEVE